MDLRGLLERHAASRALGQGSDPHHAMQQILDQQHAMVSSHQDHQAGDFIELDRQ